MFCQVFTRNHTASQGIAHSQCWLPTQQHSRQQRQESPAFYFVILKMSKNFQKKLPQNYQKNYQKFSKKFPKKFKNFKTKAQSE